MQRHSSRHFLFLSLSLTWLFWITAALLRPPEPAPVVLLLHYLGGLMPLVTALSLLFINHTSEERFDFLRRAIDFRRIGTKWRLFILLFIPATTGLGTLLDALLGGTGAQPELVAQIAQYPLTIIPVALFLFVFGPLPEELAWRGYGLDQLQRRVGALSASLILGLVWLLWHLPLFFIEGSYQYGLGIGTANFWLYQADKIPLTVIMTWLYNHTRRSILSAILFHFTVNFIGELFELSLRAEIFYIVLLWGMAIYILLAWKARSHKPATNLLKT